MTPKVGQQGLIWWDYWKLSLNPAGVIEMLEYKWAWMAFISQSLSTDKIKVNSMPLNEEQRH